MGYPTESDYYYRLADFSTAGLELSANSPTCRITIHAGKPFTIDERTTIIYPTGKNGIPESVSTCISEMEEHTSITLAKKYRRKEPEELLSSWKHNESIAHQGLG